MWQLTFKFQTPTFTQHFVGLRTIFWYARHFKLSIRDCRLSHSVTDCQESSDPVKPRRLCRRLPTTPGFCAIRDATHTNVTTENCPLMRDRYVYHPFLFFCILLCSFYVCVFPILYEFPISSSFISHVLIIFFPLFF